MRKIIEEFLNKNKDIHEFLEYIKNPIGLESDKYKNLTTTNEIDYYSASIIENHHTEYYNQIRNIYFSKINDTLFLDEVIFRKFVKSNKNINFVEFYFKLSQDNSTDFSLTIEFDAFADSMWIEIDQNFDVVYYTESSYNEKSAQLNQFLVSLAQINNTEINKAYLELFLFNKPIKNEIKDVIMLSKDLDTSLFSIFEEFGYDFRKDMLDHDIIKNIKTFKHIKNRG